MKSFNYNFKNPLGLYVHVPFCASKCSFCCFYQEKPFRNSIESYLKTAKEEMDYYFRKNIEIDTIFFGGGTPSVLTAKDFETLSMPILKLIEKKSQIKSVEWTIELAPSSVKPDKLKMFKSLGVTRVSLGIQSFHDNMLSEFRRQERAIFKAYEYIQNTEFDHVNIDLMFGFPEQKLSDWEADIKIANSLQPDHISSYMLTIEDKSDLKLPENWRTEEQELEFYSLGCDLLENFGYKQYEISNFAKPGAECLHNLNTWKMFDWIGIGPSAASQFENKRYENDSSLNLWEKSVANKEFGKNAENLTPSKLAIDCIIFGLRMNEGVCLKSLKTRFSNLNFGVLDEFLNKMTEDDLLTKKDTFLKCTKKGHLLIDCISSQLLDFEEKLVV